MYRNARQKIQTAIVLVVILCAWGYFFLDTTHLFTGTISGRAKSSSSDGAAATTEALLVPPTAKQMPSSSPATAAPTLVGESSSLDKNQHNLDKTSNKVPLLPDCENGFTALSSGTWNHNQSTSDSTPRLWTPDTCRFTPLPPSAVAQCLANRTVAFLGDSVMHRVYQKALQLLEKKDNDSLHVTTSCQQKRHIGTFKATVVEGQPLLHRYYNLSLPPFFEPPPPIHMCENPHRIDAQGQPLDWFGHTGCTGCGPEMHTCHQQDTSTAGNSSSTIKLDMNAVEFASDVELVTPEYNTTQETMVKSHLAQTQPDVVIVSAGHHDAFLWGHPGRADCRQGTVERYAQNVETYAQLLEEYQESRSSSDKSPPVQIIWFTLSLVATKWQPEKWKEKTDNGIMEQMNTAAKKIMKRHGFSVIDVWDISTNQYTVEHLNNGGVHIDGEGGLYYEVLIDAIFYDVCRGSRPS